MSNINLMDAAKMAEEKKKKHKFIKKAALEAKKKPKRKPVSERINSMYGKKK